MMQSPFKFIDLSAMSRLKQKLMPAVAHYRYVEWGTAESKDGDVARGNAGCRMSVAD
ncbi:MAG TPA: hypothetical protein VN577_08215 [Terriglobales bacterium]|nr:hypothetical protein [Terriglobales bacterium]